MVNCYSLFYKRQIFCLYYNAPQNGLLAVIGSLANLQITNETNSVCAHPRHRRLCWMDQHSNAETQWWRHFKNKLASWFNSLCSPLSQFYVGLRENAVFNKPFSMCFCAFYSSATWSWGWEIYSASSATGMLTSWLFHSPDIKVIQHCLLVEEITLNGDFDFICFF